MGDWNSKVVAFDVEQVEEGEECMLAIAARYLVEVVGTNDLAWEQEGTKHRIIPSTLEAITDVEYTMEDAEVASFSSYSTIVEVGKHYSRAQVVVVLGMIVVPQASKASQ